jgi:futalosine hydrolase
MDVLALVCAVELEAQPLSRRLDGTHPFAVGRRSGNRGRLGSKEVLIVPAGMGKTNAAQTVTAVLERFTIGGIIGFGVGGAYRGSGLEVGDVALASAQHYGDEGVETPNGWMSCAGIGIPLVETTDARLFNEFPVDAGGLSVAAEVLVDAVTGPFVTVSTCSGTASRGAVLAARYQAVCETMEGAAYAHVAAHYGVPYLEVRGISNLVEDRDLARWRLGPAAAACAAAVATIVSVWNPRAAASRSTV